jgi:hypothetical protein
MPLFFAINFYIIAAAEGLPGVDNGSYLVMYSFQFICNTSNFWIIFHVICFFCITIDAEKGDETKQAPTLLKGDDEAEAQLIFF